MYRCVLLEKNDHKLLNYSQKAGPACLLEGKGQRGLLVDGLLGTGRLCGKVSNEYRKIARIPFKVLDAPNLLDDFYLNLLEWSSQNILSVALDSCLYFWNANNNRVLKFCDISPESISSINWNATGTQLALGTSKGTT